MDIKLINKEEIQLKSASATGFDCKVEGNQVLLTNKNELVSPVAVEISLQNASFFTSIELLTAKSESAIKNIKLFTSNETKVWENITFIDQVKNQNSTIYTTPLVQCNNVQIILIPDYGIKKNSEITLTLSNNYNIDLKSSTSADRLWVIENIIDQRDDYGWSSKIHESNVKEAIEFDLNRYYTVSGIAFKSVNEDKNCFPVKFTVSVSEDKVNWNMIVSEDSFYVAKNTWYKWEYAVRKARYFKIDILELYPFAKKEFCAKILEMEIFAVPDNLYHAFRTRFIQQSYASELMPGVVRLGENKSTRPGVVIQGNDSRLRTSSTEYPGIVQLAKDGEARSGVVVQGDDARLRAATTEYPGICRLAKDGEDQGGVSVQGNDSRLRTSSTEYPGIVQLAKDGESRNGVVIQGGDSRLRLATTGYPGIVQLARDGENNGGVAVQGNDSRLKISSVENPGIVQLAAHNKIQKGLALQSDDPRLGEGGLNKKGRVQFASDGEESAMKAVQGSDKRLQPATVNDYGIVRLANPGTQVKGAVVQADDPRLFNARKPLEHTHNYAEKQHSFNSHTGFLNIEKEVITENLTPAFYSSTIKFPMSVVNETGTAAGFKGGIFTYSDNTSSIMAGSAKYSAIQGYSKDASAAELISENDYALKLPNTMGHIKGSGKSMVSSGLVSILGGVEIAGATAFVVKWKSFLSEAYSQGDLLCVDQSEQVQKIKNPQQNCIGVYVKDPQFVTFNDKKDAGGIFIAVAGVVRVKVTGNVKAGDSLGFVKGDPGVAMRLNKTGGCLVSLESSDAAGEKLVWAVFRS